MFSSTGDPGLMIQPYSYASLASTPPRNPRCTSIRLRQELSKLAALCDCSAAAAAAAAAKSTSVDEYTARVAHSVRDWCYDRLP